VLARRVDGALERAREVHSSRVPRRHGENELLAPSSIYQLR
jgi:hypothetical protein